MKIIPAFLSFAAQQANNAFDLFLLCIFPIASLCGIASLMQDGKWPRRKQVIGVALNSGFLGVAIAALMLHKFGYESKNLILSVAILSGLGGNAVTVFAIAVMKQVGKTLILSWANGLSNNKGEKE